jgi:hypothetical protein
VANFIRLAPADCVDGIAATLIPASSTTTAVSSIRFTPTTGMARWRFTCTGTSFKVQVARDGVSSGNGNNPNSIQAYVDGVYFSQTATLNAVTWLTFSGLSAGPHTVEISCGQNGVSGSKTIGNAILAIAGTNLALAPVAVSRRLLHWGDSIATSCSGNLGADDIYSLLAASYPGRVTGECMGAGTYTMWSNNTWLMSRFSAMVASATQFDFLATLGTNDYANSQPNLTTQLTTQFGLILAMPTLRRLVVMTPVTRGTETVNGAGFTMPQVRAQIAAAANAAAAAASALSKLVVLDGSSFGLNTSTDYSETPASAAIHPNNAGIAKIMPPLRTAIGF